MFTNASIFFSRTLRFGRGRHYLRSPNVGDSNLGHGVWFLGQAHPATVSCIGSFPWRGSRKQPAPRLGPLALWAFVVLPINWAHTRPAQWWWGEWDYSDGSVMSWVPAGKWHGQPYARIQRPGCGRLLPVPPLWRKNDRSESASGPVHSHTLLPLLRFGVLEGSPSKWYKGMLHDYVENKYFEGTILVSTHLECPRAPNRCEARRVGTSLLVPPGV